MTSRGRAFTVIELLIVVALVLAVGSLVVVSGFAWSASARVEAAEKGISASVEEARAMAIRLCCPVRLHAYSSDTGSTLLALDPWRESFESDEPEREETPLPPVVVYELPSGLSIMPSESSTTFTPHETDLLVQDDPVPVVLLDVFPDGQVRLAEESWQLRSASAYHVPALDSWAGALRFEPVELNALAEIPRVYANEGPAL
ncbi:MAG: hypothetical protein F6K03_15790 [Kamptonema sp. SIO4C4]|nr:hypothetical protein [Kamptonema sp. SIO4C4]